MNSLLAGYWLQLIDGSLSCWLVGALLLVVIHQVYYYLRYIRLKKCQPTEIAGELPAVSVIVCARNEEDNLRDYLHTLLNQDYPNYEVIVVDDGSEDQTTMVLEQYARLNKHMYHTFVPREARVMSTKKLALTIGVKAAHYDYLLMTDADCRPESRNWIREMMSGFICGGEQIEVVLGYGAYFEKNTLLSSLISYDTLFIGLQYLGMAAAGYPYMGVGRNLAYKKDTFFKNHGFRGLLNERSGDDDLFVNKVTNSHNTAIVCSRDSITWSPPKTTWKEWFHQKRRHLSVSPHYKRSSKLRLGIEPITRGLVYALLIATFIFGNGLAMCIAYGLWCLRLIIQLCVINISAHRLGGRMFGIEIVAYDMLLPLISLWILIAQRFRKRQLYW